MNILAIESSCDETAAAVVEDGTIILSSIIATSADMHAKYGGIVPEVAAREQLKVIIPTIDETLRQANTNLSSIDAIAITVGPGLIGSLLIGVETAKTMAMTTGKPLIPVNHVLAHMYANFVSSSEQNSSRAKPRGHIKFPAISLVVSGGHTELFLMTSPKDLKWLGGTLDDAAGEAFDKTARLLGFGSRGGVAIQEHAKKQKVDFTLPRPMMHDGSLNFSFSGLKTATIRGWNKYKDTVPVSAFAYEVQETICDVLVAKTIHAAEKYDTKSILISGGVAANLRLREKMQGAAEKNAVNLFIPPINLCTDNAVYIGSYAYFRGVPTDWHKITAIPDMSVEDI